MSSAVSTYFYTRKHFLSNFAMRHSVSRRFVNLFFNDQLQWSLMKLKFNMKTNWTQHILQLSHYCAHQYSYFLSQKLCTTPLCYFPCKILQFARLERQGKEYRTCSPKGPLVCWIHLVAWPSPSDRWAIFLSSETLLPVKYRKLMLQPLWKRCLNL